MFKKYKIGDKVTVTINHTYPKYVGYIDSFVVEASRSYYEVMITDKTILLNSLVDKKYNNPIWHNLPDGKRVSVYAIERVYNLYSLALVICKQSLITVLKEKYN